TDARTNWLGGWRDAREEMQQGLYK
ncbi:ribosome modulation factor, partial [Photobacterium phosphoreum]